MVTLLRKRETRDMRGRKSLLWPEVSPELSDPVRGFSPKFCRKKSKALTGLPLLSYHAGEKIKALLSRLPAENILVVTDPEIVLSPKAPALLFEALEEGALFGPVFNASTNPSQQAALPAPYFDLPTFLEAAEILARDQEVITTDALDPACFACRRETLARFPEFTLPELPKALGLTLRVVKGALVHTFRPALSAPREELLTLIPRESGRLLDVGCAGGAFGRLLRERFPEMEIQGLEPDPLLAAEAEKVYQKLWRLPFPSEELPSAHYDVVHLGDVLEHLQDPWEALSCVRRILKPKGFLTGSVPNVGHWTVVRALLEGDFEYLPHGILSVGHLRFFTPKSLARLLEEEGFELEIFEPLKPPPLPSGEEFIRRHAPSSEARENLLTAGILFRARKAV